MGNAIRGKSGEQVVAECILRTYVCSQLPVVPSVIAAECDLVAAGVGPCNANCNGHRLSTASGIAHHLRPRMNFTKQIGQSNFFGAIQSRHGTAVDGGMHCVVDVGVGVIENARSKSTMGHLP
jgi:hypothetical protein